MGEGGKCGDASHPSGYIDLLTTFCKKAPRRSVLFPIRLKNPPYVDQIFSLLASVSAQDLRSLEDVEKETVETVLECSPRGILEDESRLSDSETSSSKPSTSCFETQSTPHNAASLWQSFFRLWRTKSMRRLSSFPPFGVPKLIKKKTGKENLSDGGSYCTGDNSFCFFGPTLRTFTVLELRNATNNFSQDNLIGKGGFAEVYKGELEDGKLVAIKRLKRGTSEEKTVNFLSELGIIFHINHPNVAKLIGVGIEDDMHLVLQLSPNGNLKTLLHSAKDKLDWGVRYKVAFGIAEGLEYLHERCQKRIIHRDIKPSNILLTEDFEPQICDFGLARWLPDQISHHTVSSFEGTFGYVAPEYSMHGIVDEKIDVFAFGILLLELISGRKALDSSMRSLVGWARPMIKKNDVRGLVDPSLGEAYDSEQLKCMMDTANLCIQHSSVLRPQMSQVLSLLKGAEGRPVSVKVHQKPLRCRTYSEEIFDLEEYNAARYLTDMSRHKQLALDFQNNGHQC